MELDYLVIAAHPDDAELGVGGTILGLKALGAKVGVLDLTNGEPTPHGTPDLRARETEAASRILALDWRGNLGLANRALVADLEARRRLAGTLRQLRPRVLLTHYWEDSHPDHVAASALVDAARFWAKLTKTDLPAEPHFPTRILYYFSLHLPPAPKTVLRRGRDGPSRSQDEHPGLLSLPVHRRPANRITHCAGRHQRPRAVLGLDHWHRLW